MAKLNLSALSQEQLDEYAAQSNGGLRFFKLADDGDTATVRFMWETMQDVDFYSVHSIEIDGKTKSINCLREYGEPVDTCPICANMLNKPENIVYIPFFVVNSDNQDMVGKTVIWNKSLAFWQKVVQPLMVKHGEPFCGNLFKITRKGKAGDTNTRYDLSFISHDDTRLDDFEEDVPNPSGVLVHDKTFDEMNNFVRYGTFAVSDTDETQVRRRTSARDDVPTRRTGRPPVDPIV